MVGGGKDIGKASVLNKPANRGSDKFTKKKSSQGPATKIPRPSDSAEVPKSVLINEDFIEKLIIKDEDLDMLRKSLEESKPLKTSQIPSPPKTYAVKVPKSLEKIRSSEKTQKFLVAKPAPQNARLKAIESAPCGPRYTQDGVIIPHSILGSVQDFVTEAIKRKEMEPDSAAATAAMHDRGLLQVKQYERPFWGKNPYIPTAFNQENALLNWRKRMAERKKMQGHISDLLEKPLDRLVMSQDLNTLRRIREKKMVLDRDVHRIKCGMEEKKCHSEFWKLSAVVGDPVDGLRTTLTNTEKGCPPVIEHIGKSNAILTETGENSEPDRPTVDFSKRWNDSKYLKKRFHQLKPYLKDIDPLNHDLSNLEVTGLHHSKQRKLCFTDTEPRFNSSLYTDIHQTQPFEGFETAKPLEKYPDVVDNPMMGPSILFDGIPAYWNGSSNNNKEQIGAVTRVNFECIAGHRTTTSINVKNNGTTAIFYEWRKIHHVPSFEVLKPDQTQRFYFNANEGQILPGDTLHISFVFKSSIAGIFTEEWDFLTTPTVMGGASLFVVLKGVAVLDDSDTVAKRNEIEQKLEKKNALFTVKRLVEEMLRGIRTPDRPSSPLDSYKSEEKIFCEKNSKLSYDFNAVQKLKNVFTKTIEPDSIIPEWGLSIAELHTCVLTVPNEEKRGELLTEMNRIISDLSFPVLFPRRNMLYNVAYYHLLQMLDKFVSCSMLVRSTMSLPEVVMTEPITVPEIHSSAHSTNYSISPTDEKRKGRRSAVAAPKDAKEDKTKKGKPAAKEAPSKDKEPRPRTANKTKAGHHSAHGDEHSKRQKHRGAPTPTMTIEDEEPSEEEMVEIDHETRRLYIHKFYGHVRSLITNMMEDIVAGFEDVEKVQPKVLHNPLKKKKF